MALKRNLSQGMSGSDVKELQNMLITLGYSLGSAGADGQFGPITTAAVEKFQVGAGLRTDGIVGLDTYNALVQSLVSKGVIAPVDKQISIPTREVILHRGTQAPRTEGAYPPPASIIDWKTVGLIAAGVIGFLFLFSNKE